MAAAISLAFTLFLTPVFLRLFRKWGWGQVIRTPEAAGNPSHEAKRGTPTMGGVIFILGSIVGYFTGVLVSGETPALSAILVIWLMVGFGVVGFIDDYMKVRSQRSLGLSGWRKVIGQLIVVIPFGIVALNFPNKWGQTPASASISLFRDITWLNLFAFGVILGWTLYLAWISIIGVATSNSVNLTDGLDGLAIMPTVMVGGGLGIFCYLSGNVNFAEYLLIPYIPGSGELIVFCGALIGAGLGFLWFNTYPAQVFMGDVGALALGAALGTIAVIVRQEVVLFIMGGVFVMETLSVMIQVASFKLTGKRVFRMAPIHHHFELKGWPEPRVIVRFWIITVILVLVGLATLKLR